MLSPQLAYGAAFVVFFLLFGKKAYGLLQDLLKEHREKILHQFETNNMLLKKAREDHEKLLLEEEKLAEQLKALHQQHEEDMASLKQEHLDYLEHHRQFYAQKKEQQEKITAQHFKKKLLAYQWSLVEERLKNNLHNHRDESMAILLKGAQKAMDKKVKHGL